MSRREEVHLGSGQTIVWDSDTGTYTVTDVQGAILEARPLTEEESATLVSVPEVPSAPDLVALANEMADQRARLLAAEDVLGVLLLNDLNF